MDEFIRLYHEFQKAMLAKTEEHVRKHKCASPADVHALSELAPKEFWPRWQELTRSCAGRRAVPGPVPPRLAEPTRK